MPFQAEHRNCLPSGSFPYDVFPVVGSHLPPEAYHSSGYVASSAFRTLSRLFSARYLPALFHAGPAHGVSPFRVLRRPQSDPLFRASLPSCGLRALFLRRTNRFRVCGLPSGSTFSSRSLRYGVSSGPPHFRASIPAGGSFSHPNYSFQMGARDPPGLHPP
jgi:hypothetical protein